MKQFIKMVYRFIPFKKNFYSILKIFWKPNEKIYKHLYFTQPYEVKIDKNRRFKIYNGNQIENEIFWEGLTGKWEKESMKIWIQLCEFSYYIFDIGANTGIYALVGKTINPKAKVYAFEPHPFFFRSLQKNIEINNYDINIYRKAISNIDGKISIGDYKGEENLIIVDAIQLDTFIQENKIEKIDLLKIDVETHEPKVLEGFIKNISKYKPTFLIEILNDDIASHIYNIVDKHGYLYFNIDENKGIRKTDKIEKSDSFNYLLCTREVADKLGLI